MKRIGSARAAATAWLAVMVPLAPAFGQVTAQPLTLAEAAKIFGARESVEQMSLSPDGQMLAMIQPVDGRGAMVGIADLSVKVIKPVPILASTGDPERLDWCRWSGTRRLLCRIYGVIRIGNGDLSYTSRMVAIDADGKRMQAIPLPRGGGDPLGYALSGGSVIDWNTGEDGHILMARSYVPEFSTGNRNAQTADGYAVDDMDTNNLRSVKAERARPTATEYISDGHGHVRIMGMDTARSPDGYSSARTQYLYRTGEKGNWQTLGEYDSTTQIGFNPYYVDPTLNVAYGLKRQNGRAAAYSVSLDGAATEQLIFAHPDVDVNGFAVIGRSRRVIGVTYTTDKSEVVYFDPALKRLATALSKAVPDLPLIRFIDSSQDERKLLIWAGSDVDPGRYYLYDRDKRTLDEVAYNRVPLMRVPLATVKSVQVKAADGTLIPAYLTLPAGSDGKNLPAIVMPHGGPSARDSWGFDWLSQFWANRGYAVLQPNYRGSSGYGDEWFQDNGFQSWKVAIGDVTDSARWLIEQGIADPAKLAIFGWSYGGYAALQSAVTQPGLFRGVIAVAPVADLGRLKEEWSGWSSYRLQQDFIGSGPHIEEGSPARQASRITVPVLMFHGTDDRNVSIRQSRLMADRLRDAGKAGRLVTYDKLDHYLEDSTAREDMLSQSAAFLEQSFAAGAR